MFDRISTNKLPYKAEDLPKQITGEYILPCLTSSFKNQGLNFYAPRTEATILKNVISIPSNSDVYRAYYQPNEFAILSDAYAIHWIYSDKALQPNQYLFIVMCINKVTDLSIYSYKNKLGGWNVVKNKYIQLPTKNGKIDFDFMDKFIAELSAQRYVELKVYLSVTGLKDTRLSFKEEQALREYEHIEWKAFNLEALFGKSTRGKRLKSADRIVGKLPFVTAGEADEGISAFIGNDVTVFSNNTTTIDMFGSAKYRNYKYGGDDHITVVHTEKLSKFAAIFTTAAIHKSSHTGKFDYGHNFYAKDADELWISLPTKDKQPDYDTMEIIVSAIQKLVIKDVVVYADKKIEATKNVVCNDANDNSLPMAAETSQPYGEDS